MPDPTTTEDQELVAVRFLGPQATASVITEHGRALFTRDDALNVPAELAEQLLESDSFEAADGPADRNHDELVDFIRDEEGVEVLVRVTDPDDDEAAGAAADFEDLVRVDGERRVAAGVAAARRGRRKSPVPVEVPEGVVPGETPGWPVDPTTGEPLDLTDEQRAELAKHELDKTGDVAGSTTTTTEN